MATLLALLNELYGAGDHPLRYRPRFWHREPIHHHPARGRGRNVLTLSLLWWGQDLARTTARDWRRPR